MDDRYICFQCDECLFEVWIPIDHVVELRVTERYVCWGCLEPMEKIP